MAGGFIFALQIVLKIGDEGSGHHDIMCKAFIIDVECVFRGDVVWWLFEIAPFDVSVWKSFISALRDGILVSSLYVFIIIKEMHERGVLVYEHFFHIVFFHVHVAIELLDVEESVVGAEALQDVIEEEAWDGEDFDGVVESVHGDYFLGDVSLVDDAGSSDVISTCFDDVGKKVVVDDRILAKAYEAIGRDGAIT